MTTTKIEEYLRHNGLPIKRQRGFDDLHNFAERYQHREHCIREYGFAIPTGKVIEKLRKYGPFIEIGAGTGYWTYELRQAGIPAIATDLKPVDEKHPRKKGSDNENWEDGRNVYPFQRNWVNVVPLDASAAARAFDDWTLLTVWPCYKERWAARALLNYRGNTVVYVGEGHGGCTADDLFHKILDKHWEETEVIMIPTHPGIHDNLYVYKRKP